MGYYGSTYYKDVNYSINDNVIKGTIEKDRITSNALNMYEGLTVRIELPEGYEALIAPRSSTFKNFHIIQTNSVGVIDNSYCGPNDEWKMPVYATEDTVIHKNDRICQFRILKNQNISNIYTFDTTERLETETNRGGFGSTGVN